MVKTLEGGTITLMVEQKDKIAEVNRRMQAKLGIELRGQGILWNGKLLDGKGTIGDYNIGKDSMLRACYGLQGGMQGSNGTPRSLGGPSAGAEGLLKSGQTAPTVAGTTPRS